MFDPTRASLRSRIAQRAPLGVFWMSLGSPTVLEIAANAKKARNVFVCDSPDQTN